MMRGILRNASKSGRWKFFIVLGALALGLLIISIIDLAHGGDSGAAARCVAMVCTLLGIVITVREARSNGDM